MASHRMAKAAGLLRPFPLQPAEHHDMIEVISFDLMEHRRQASMIKAIGHLAFGVADLEKSLQFYVDVLGFRKMFEMRNAEDIVAGIYIRVAHEQYLELFRAAKVENGSAPSYRHLCLHVEDLDAVLKQVKDHSWPVDREKTMGKDGNWQAWIQDPDGNRIEFMQLMPDSKQRQSDPM
jgi:lactoylglutathione lyase